MVILTNNTLKTILFVGTPTNRTKCNQLTEQSTIEREFKPLLQIKDNYPKYILSMGRFWKDNIKGINHLHIADFLLLKEF